MLKPYMITFIQDGAKENYYFDTKGQYNEALKDITNAGLKIIYSGRQ